MASWTPAAPQHPPITDEAKAAVRRALTIDRHRFGVYDKQAASIMERFERIGTVVEMRQFLEDDRVLAGCCLRSCWRPARGWRCSAVWRLGGCCRPAGWVGNGCH